MAQSGKSLCLATETLRVVLLSILFLGLAPAVAGQPLSFSAPASSSIYGGDAGVAYNPLFTMVAAGGTPPYTYSIVGAPSWISVNSATGVGAGTPTTQGAYTFSLKVVDHAGSSVTEPIYIDIAPDVSMVTSSLPAAPLGFPYSAPLQAAGGTPTFYPIFSNLYYWSITSGSLPPGLSLASSGSSNSIAGTPTAVGTYNFTLQVTDANGFAGTSASANLSIVVAGPPLSLISPASGAIVGGDAGDTYSPIFTMVAVGGTPPYTYSVVSAPSWLSVNASTGVVSGTPPAPGVFVLPLKVVDHAGAGQTEPVTFDVAPDVSMVTSSLPNAQLGVSYSAPLQASGGTPYYYPAFSNLYYWSVTSGSLPPGLSLTSSGSSNSIAGTPTAGGTYSFTLQVTDANGFAGTWAAANFSIVVASPNPTTLTAVPAFLSFSYNLGSTAPAAQTIAVGSTNPASGVAFNVATSGQSWLSATLGSGTVGAPTPGTVSVAVNPNGLSAGTYNGTVTITSSAASSLSVPVTLTVTGVPPAISATPASLTFNYIVGGSLPAGQTRQRGEQQPQQRGELHRVDLRSTVADAQLPFRHHTGHHYRFGEPRGSERWNLHRLHRYSCVRGLQQPPDRRRHSGCRAPCAHLLDTEDAQRSLLARAIRHLYHCGSQRGHGRYHEWNGLRYRYPAIRSDVGFPGRFRLDLWGRHLCARRPVGRGLQLSLHHGGRKRGSEPAFFQVTNQASVSGGDSAAASASDTAPVVVSTAPTISSVDNGAGEGRRHRPEYLGRNQGVQSRSGHAFLAGIGFRQ